MVDPHAKAFWFIAVVGGIFACLMLVLGIGWEIRSRQLKRERREKRRAQRRKGNR